jgi:hypothetical protein
LANGTIQKLRREPSLLAPLLEDADFRSYWDASIAWNQQGRRRRIILWDCALEIYIVATVIYFCFVVDSTLFADQPPYWLLTGIMNLGGVAGALGAKIVRILRSGSRTSPDELTLKSHSMEIVLGGVFAIAFQGLWMVYLGSNWLTKHRALVVPLAIAVGALFSTGRPAMFWLQAFQAVRKGHSFDRRGRW